MRTPVCHTAVSSGGGGVHFFFSEGVLLPFLLLLFLGVVCGQGSSFAWDFCDLYQRVK